MTQAELEYLDSISNVLNQIVEQNAKATELLVGLTDVAELLTKKVIKLEADRDNQN